MSTKDLSYYLAIKYPVELFERAGGRYFATHPDLDGCMAEGETLEEVMVNLADARELWISAKLKRGYGVPEPVSEDFSGKLSLRMAPSLHAQLAHLADRSQVSLNLLINSVLASYAGGADPLASLLSEIRAALKEFNSPSPEVQTVRTIPASNVTLHPSSISLINSGALRSGSIGGRLNG